MDKLKKASRTVVDTGAKTMLKVRFRPWNSSNSCVLYTCFRGNSFNKKQGQCRTFLGYIYFRWFNIIRSVLRSADRHPDELSKAALGTGKHRKTRELAENTIMKQGSYNISQRILNLTYHFPYTEYRPMFNSWTVKSNSASKSLG